MINSSILKDVTVILPLYKTPFEKISLLKNYKSINTIVLDQCGDINSKKKIKNQFNRKLQYFNTTHNLGFSKACNILLSKVKTKFCLLTQADILININTILKLKKIFYKEKKCIVAAPKIIYTSKNFLKNNSSFKDDCYIKVKNIIGACFLFDVKKMKKIGFFDEDFFLYWEDVHLCHKIHKSNYKIFELKNYSALHYSAQSSTNNLNVTFLRNLNYVFGEYLFFFKIKKLRSIKILRQLVQRLFYFFYNFSIMNFKKSFIEFCKFLGILKFITFIITKYFFNFNKIIFENKKERWPSG